MDAIFDGNLPCMPSLRRISVHESKWIGLQMVRGPICAKNTPGEFRLNLSYQR
jgi:hypothetical protein